MAADTLPGTHAHIHSSSSNNTSNKTNTNTQCLFFRRRAVHAFDAQRKPPPTRPPLTHTRTRARTHTHTYTHTMQGMDSEPTGAYVPAASAPAPSFYTCARARRARG